MPAREQEAGGGAGDRTVVAVALHHQPEERAVRTGELQQPDRLAALAQHDLRVEFLGVRVSDDAGDSRAQPLAQVRAAAFAEHLLGLVPDDSVPVAKFYASVGVDDDQR